MTAARSAVSGRMTATTQRVVVTPVSGMSVSPTFGGVVKRGSDEPRPEVPAGTR